jgi:hypothetical protein
MCLAVIGGGGWRVEPQLGTQQCQLVTFQIADRHPAPAIGGAAFWGSGCVDLQMASNT